MPSLINQMRSTLPPQQLNDSIARTRALMQQFSYMQNPQAAMINIIQQNPQLRGLLASGTNLEALARQMAQARGLDINQILTQLQGGI